MADTFEKRYYTIGEVADMFKVSKSLIRFWEGEFDILKPHKNSKGDRRFTSLNIEQVRLIYHLVKERGFTLEGAKREIAQEKDRYKEKRQVLDRLQQIKAFLLDVKNQL